MIYAGASGALTGGTDGHHDGQERGAVRVSMFMSDDIKEQIRAIIREEMGKTGGKETVPVENPPADETTQAKQETAETVKPVEGNEKAAAVEAEPGPAAATDPGNDRLKEFFSKRIAGVMANVAEDLSTIAGEKVKFTENEFAVKSYSEIMTAKDKFVISMGESEQGEKIFIRIPARAAVKLSGTMTMIPEAVLKEKMASLNLSNSDIDGVKEVCNQAMGSVNKGAIRKYKLKDVIFTDDEKEKAAVGDVTQQFISVDYSVAIGADSYKETFVCIPMADAAGIMAEGR
jgi:hypothetical protein